MRRRDMGDPGRATVKTMAKALTICATSLLLAVSSGVAIASAQASALQPAGPSGFASSADVQAQIREMLATMKPDQGFMWRPLVRDGATAAAIEIWKKPGRPAVHPAEAEYAIVLDGAGTLVSGGTMADAKVSNANLIEGSQIEGGVTRALGPGDVILIPAGIPHWFGVAGDRLVLLGIKLPSAK